MSFFAILIIAIKVFAGFSVLILIHEFGHFIIAKISGVWVEEFGLGLPPKIWGKKIGGTVYSLNLLPIGGFVKLYGESASDAVVYHGVTSFAYPQRAFTNKRKLTKVFITLAGIIMNFVLAVACFGIVFSFLGIPGKIDIKIVSVNENSPASAAGIMKGDIIEKVGSTVIVNDTQFVSEIGKFKGQNITLEILRDNGAVKLDITPRENPPEGQGALGIEFTPFQEAYFPPVWQRPFVGAWYGLKQALSLSKAVILGLGSSVKSVSQGQAPKGVVGPVGIIGLFIEFTKLGILPLINLIGVVSINLAIINLIPFPPLDGSRIGLVIAEAVTRKKMTAKMEERVYLIGFIVLIGLMILITSHEIPAILKSGSLGNYVDSVLNQK